MSADVAAMDRWYLDYIEAVSPKLMSEPVPFTFTDGDRAMMSRQEMLTHIVTHGGYHRGEIGRILMRIGIAPPWDTFAVHLHHAEPCAGCRCASGLALRGLHPLASKGSRLPGRRISRSFVSHFRLASLAPKLAISLLVGETSDTTGCPFKCCLSWIPSTHSQYTSKKLAFNLVLFLRPLG
ncbi:DinB family protein [Mesorhizobium sp. RSR565B]|uniref:DinB family protein n=1 Tax=unclassified Mesorhizobium TaxID=325217 RepID=UPI0032AEF062